MPPPAIHVIEPTLCDQTGHCHSFIGSLLAANVGSHPLRLELWSGRSSGTLFAESATLRTHPVFFQPLRRPQAFLLLRRLLRTPDKLFLSTATRTDLLLLDWAAPGIIPPGKVFLYFHWLRLSERKRRFLEKIAVRQPHLVVMAPSRDILARLTSCGFRNGQVVPYPVTSSATPPTITIPHRSSPQTPVPFRHLLFAGAARMDKGFAQIVKLVEFLHHTGGTIPFVIQTSPPHHGRLEPEVCAELSRLRAIGYPYLQMLAHTLNAEQYRALFPGAISIQPYDRAEFAGDRVSGVTLDSLMAGAPVVVTSATLMARMAERFGAGIAVDDLSPESLWGAVQKIHADYAIFQARALAAGAALRQENSAGHLLDILGT